MTARSRRRQRLARASFGPEWAPAECQPWRPRGHRLAWLDGYGLPHRHIDRSAALTRRQHRAEHVRWGSVWPLVYRLRTEMRAAFHAEVDRVLLGALYDDGTGHDYRDGACLSSCSGHADLSPAAVPAALRAILARVAPDDGTLPPIGDTP